MSRFERLLLWLMRTDRQHIEHTDWFIDKYGRDKGKR